MKGTLVESVKNHQTDQQIQDMGTRWAPISDKLSYNPYKWPYKWVTGVVTHINGVISYNSTYNW